MGGRGSLQTISKHFSGIKARLACGEELDASHLTETDLEALKNLVGDMINRRTWLARTERDEGVRAAVELAQRLEADLASKDEIINDFEHQVAMLEEEIGIQMLVIDSQGNEIAQLRGMVQALHATIATLSPSESQPTKPGENTDDLPEAPPREANRETRGSAAARRLVRGIDEDNVDTDDES